jgi:aerobic carbon-monoxide dehydrogenase small subunit
VRAQTRPLKLKVNGEERITTCREADLLLDVLRVHFGLTGSKPGCLNGDCGSCTILLDDVPMKSCLMLGVEAEGKTIETIEGLDDSPVQSAFIEHNAFQCGYCTPGFIMNIEGLLRQKEPLDQEQVVDFLQSNICRCTSYEEIWAATSSVLTKNRKEATSTATPPNHLPVKKEGEGQ